MPWKMAGRSRKNTILLPKSSKLMLKKSQIILSLLSLRSQKVFGLRWPQEGMRRDEEEGCLRIQDGKSEAGEEEKAGKWKVDGVHVTLECLGSEKLYQVKTNRVRESVREHFFSFFLSFQEFYKKSCFLSMICFLLSPYLLSTINWVFVPPNIINGLLRVIMPLIN